jgi:rhodanese-related sulfurtransferase
MSLIFWCLFVFGAVSVAWFCFENRWDRRLFAAEPGKKRENLRAGAAMEFLQTTSKVQVLDVRSEKEFAGGALPDAISVPLSSHTFRERTAQLDRTVPILVYCAGGFRSRKAVELLRDLGFESIYHLHRGYHSWQLAGLPVVKSQTMERDSGS